MPTPAFITELRQHVGHAPLWLSSVTCVVTRGEDILLIQRSDNGIWTPVSGIIEPGEQPAAVARREVWEEAHVECDVTRLAGVDVTDHITYTNGDVSQYLNLTFSAEWVSGTPTPDHEETQQAQWFPRANLPDMPGHHRARTDVALSTSSAAQFDKE